jgi:hypothetical protein
VIVVEENLGAIAQLEQLAEQQFAQLIQEQIALVNEVEIIKNNIRLNHFKAKFSQVVSLTSTGLSVRTAADFFFFL